MSEYSDIEDLEKASVELVKPVKELRKAHSERLTFKLIEYDRDGAFAVETGILWIPGPFKTDFWSKARKKPNPVKCQCACGHKHSPPKGKEVRHD